MKGSSPAESIAPNDRLIFALDGMSEDEALKCVSDLQSEIGIFKIGPSLVYGSGLEIAHRIAEKGKERKIRVFLDMKTWDIPETVFRALEAIEQFGGQQVAFVTVHAFNTDLRRLLRPKEKRSFLVFAVSLLTSLDKRNLEEFGSSLAVEEFVLRQAGRAIEFGLDGVIASGLEAGTIKREFGDALQVITPGIRPRWAEIKQDDQKRIVTPREAILNGADYLVVGRPIRNSPDGPLAAARRIQQEIREALREKEENPAPPPIRGGMPVVG